ncbi:MAG TPA: transposase [Ktedonobacteraceae bacterium]|nr:transposase [Ktedonobacteraceae bacterium]
MNLNTLNEFRHGVYGCFGNGRDALFNLVDALASETGARSFPELSFSPFFERTWASLYEALEDGRIDAERLRKVFADFAPLPQAGKIVFLGIDTSNLSRPEAETAADRTLVQIANLPKNTHAASPGWVMSHVVLLPRQAGQGTFVLDTARVTSGELATEVAARQLRAVVALLVARGLCPIILGDRWYACAPFLARLADVEASELLRVKSNRVFYRPAPERLPGQLGASRKDGDRFQCKDTGTHGEPDETWEGVDAKGARIEVRCWKQLHLRTARWVELMVIEIIRHGATGRARDPKISWFVWKGDEPAPLAEISPTYRLRYSHEHGYRFDKQELLWDVPRLSTPERTERWTQVVACAHNLLVLARPLLEGGYRPWETRRAVPTLTQVRRAMPTLLHELGTPARPPQLRGKAPGRAKGFHPTPRTRHAVIRKTSKKPKKSKKVASV